jgi:hypothetical protein
LRLFPDHDLFPVFNDTCRSFAVLRALILDARNRAQADLSRHTASEAIAA